MTDPAPETRALLKGLTVADLRAKLADLPDDMPVIVYGEHGQNGESPASDVTVGWYRPESTWGGEFRTYDEHDDDCGTDCDDPDHGPDPVTEVPAVFIEPIN
jgi:hypothetical protein